MATGSVNQQRRADVIKGEIKGEILSRNRFIGEKGDRYDRLDKGIVRVYARVLSNVKVNVT
jgi:hypothetical protein